MSDKLSLQTLLEIQTYFGLPSPALVEKDWHVVQALAAITAADTAPLRLVFGGGTALSRAHRLIRRMSEDSARPIVSIPWRKRCAPFRRWKPIAAMPGAMRHFAALWFMERLSTMRPVWVH